MKAVKEAVLRRRLRTVSKTIGAASAFRALAKSMGYKIVVGGRRPPRSKWVGDPPIRMAAQLLTKKRIWLANRSDVAVVYGIHELTHGLEYDAGYLSAEGPGRVLVERVLASKGGPRLLRAWERVVAAGGIHTHVDRRPGRRRFTWSPKLFSVEMAHLAPLGSWPKRVLDRYFRMFTKAAFSPFWKWRPTSLSAIFQLVKPVGSPVPPWHQPVYEMQNRATAIPTARVRRRREAIEKAVEAALKEMRVAREMFVTSWAAAATGPQLRRVELLNDQVELRDKIAATLGAYHVELDSLGCEDVGERLKTMLVKSNLGLAIETNRWTADARAGYLHASLGDRLVLSVVCAEPETPIP